MVRLLVFVAAAHAFAPLQRIARHIHTSKPWAGALSASEGGGEEKPAVVAPEAAEPGDASYVAPRFDAVEPEAPKAAVEAPKAAVEAPKAAVEAPKVKDAAPPAVEALKGGATVADWRKKCDSDGVVSYYDYGVGAAPKKAEVKAAPPKAAEKAPDDPAALLAQAAALRDEVSALETAEEAPKVKAAPAPPVVAKPAPKPVAAPVAAKPAPAPRPAPPKAAPKAPEKPKSMFPSLFGMVSDAVAGAADAASGLADELLKEEPAPAPAPAPLMHGHSCDMMEGCTSTEYTSWPFMTGYLQKKGRTRRNWNQVRPEPNGIKAEPKRSDPGG